MASVIKPAVTRVPTQLPGPMRYSAAAAAGSSNSAQTSTPATETSQPALTTAQSPPTAVPVPVPAVPPVPGEHAPPAPPSPSLTQPSMSMSSPVLSSVGLPAPSQASRASPPPDSQSFDSAEDSPMLAEAQPAATSSPHRIHPQRSWFVGLCTCQL